MNWDNGATIGFKGSGDFYATNDPSTSDVACLNYPASNYSNVIFLLSNISAEIPMPGSYQLTCLLCLAFLHVAPSKITTTYTFYTDMVTTNPLADSVSVTWRIPSFTTEEKYYIRYGTDRYKLDQQSASFDSDSDTTMTNLTYNLEITGLEPGTIYYLQIVAVFERFSKRQSEIAMFRTKEDGKTLNFTKCHTHLILNHRASILLGIPEYH